MNIKWSIKSYLIPIVKIQIELKSPNYLGFFLSNQQGTCMIKLKQFAKLFQGEKSVNKKEFWSLIEESKSKEEQAEWLIEALSKKDLNEIVDFELHFQGLMNESYQSRLWAAGYILMGGCSDDTFDYFRGWLIGQGEEIYQIVMENHEFLANYINDENLDEEGYPQNEDLINVGQDAYTLLKTGDIEWDDESYDELLEKLEQKGLKPANEIEFDWDEEDSDGLEAMFPKIWARFGEDPLG